MKKLYFLFFLALGLTSSLQAQFCNANGNYLIFSNYDGGILRINVDQNIPNLRIGIVSYEDDSVIISGTFVSNVTKVVYAGYFNSSNNHCGNPHILVKGVYGVSSTIVTINFMPTATYNNPNGWNQIICNTNCSTTTNQGGCNTPDQLVAYFNTQFAATNSNLLFHFTQYGCWQGTYNVSAGGNCCLLPVSTDDIKNKLLQSIFLFPNPAQTIIHVETNVISASEVQLEIYNLLGEKVYSDHYITNGTLVKEINVANLNKGIYNVRMVCGNETVSKKLIIE